VKKLTKSENVMGLSAAFSQKRVRVVVRGRIIEIFFILLKEFLYFCG